LAFASAGTAIAGCCELAYVEVQERFDPSWSGVLCRWLQDALGSWTSRVVVAVLRKSSPVVVDFQLLNARAGWALTTHELSWTRDGGRSWDAITPSGVDAGAIRDVFFLDARRGWALAADPPRAWTTYVTKDGGRSWAAAPFPGDSRTYGEKAETHLDFVDGVHGWAMVKIPTSSNFSAGDLFRTVDGGTTWKKLSIPVGDEIDFADGGLGWIAGGPAGDELYATRDAGDTWTRVDVDLPHVFSESTPAYGTPTFFDPRAGVLPVTFTGNPAGFAFYVTSDGGRTWDRGPVVRSRRSIATGVRLLADPVTPDVWYVVNPQGRGRMVSVRGTTVRVERGEGLGGGAFALDFGTTVVGWVATSHESCPGKTGCTSDVSLLATKSGGDGWHEISPP
jgi:photosystem II stability/assembly factor-like uncharacterized protein